MNPCPGLAPARTMGASFPAKDAIGALVTDQNLYLKGVSRMADHYLLQFFRFEHLPDRLQKVSRPFGELARTIAEGLPDNPEKTTALRKLLEAKDCSVRASLFELPSLPPNGVPA